MAELSAKVVEVRALAKLLYFLPPPARTQFANELHGLGARVHAELATLELETYGPKSMGNHAPQRPVSKRATAEQPAAELQVMDVLRKSPDLAHIADAIAALKADPVTAQRIADAKTNEERLALARELGVEVPDDMFAPGGPVEQLKDRIDSLRPEDLE